MRTDSNTLTGRRCVVTGGGSGIGRGIALVLAARGAQVTVTGRRLDRLTETMRLAQGDQMQTEVMDVRDPDSVRAAAAAITARLGGIDVLVNNAGVGGPNACVVPGEDRWAEILQTNLDGAFYCTRAFAPHMADAGRIVNVASVVGKFGVPGYTAYAASKLGLIGFTRSLALECAPRKITVNAICPGWVETDMARAGLENLAQGLSVDYATARRDALRAVPLGQMIEPQEIGELVAYLCSDAARNMTGQAISLCGGSTMS